MKILLNIHDKKKISFKIQILWKEIEGGYLHCHCVRLRHEDILEAANSESRLLYVFVFVSEASIYFILQVKRA